MTRLPHRADEDERDHHAGAKAASALGALTLAVLTRERTRLLATTAGLLTVTSLLITRCGNVPIDSRVKQWAAAVPPTDHAKILSRRELSNDSRTCKAVAAFAILIYVALR
ncbi:hypothetical protein [Streptomyces sp. cg35]|uniref:hypothetical protein n=1 Tax=Streptomyces sp. cg35 TaxID=3421650 RepID=UPI003D181853